MAMSLRRTLVLVLVTVLVVIYALALAWGYQQSNDELNEVFDAELAQTAGILRTLVREKVDPRVLQQLHRSLNHRLRSASPEKEDDDSGADRLLDEEVEHHYQKRMSFQIWTDRLAPLLKGPDLVDDRALEPGYDWVDSDGQRWRTFTLHDSLSHTWIRTAQRVDLRRAISAELALGSTLPLLLALPLLILLVPVAIWWVFRPLVRLENHMDSMDPQTLVHLDEQLAPREVRGLVRAINALLVRLGQALEREKQFTANAAHELRTPLTALRLNLEDQARKDPDAAQPLLKAVDRMVHLVEQMLILSRLDPESSPQLESCDLHQLAADTLAELAPLALRSGRELQLEGRGPVPCRANPPLLATLIRNLVNNALQYTEPGTRVEVRVAHHEDAVTVQVCDQGPGIAPEQREAALQRFVRLDGRRGQGAGLGLSIAQRIAQLHGGSLVLGERPDGRSGLCVMLVLPIDRPQNPRSGAI